MTLLAIVAVLVALAARAAAEPPRDADPDGDVDAELDGDPELDEIVARPEIMAAPGEPDAVAALDDLGAEGIGAIAGSEDWLEAQARHQRPSPWGRLDLELSILHREDAPATVAPHRFDELWLSLAWRR